MILVKFSSSDKNIITELSCKDSQLSSNSIQNWFWNLCSMVRLKSENKEMSLQLNGTNIEKSYKSKNKISHSSLAVDHHRNSALAVSSTNARHRLMNLPSLDSPLTDV
jgi:hypothetical protein